MDKKKKSASIENQLLIDLVCTQSRVEPAQPLQPLVFETSASTDSAIWASVGAKVYIFGEKAKRRKIRSIGFWVAFTKLLEAFWPNTCRRWDFDSDKRRCGCVLETGCHFQIAAKTDS